MKELIDIKYWIFDLDNTLYSGQTQVFSEVDKKMSAFISKKMNVDLVKAKEIQKKYFYEYGTTLSGLMKQDGIDPHDFLEFVHDIDISWLPKDLKLREELIKIKENQITKPIPTSSGFLILMIKGKNKIEKEINLEEELKKLIRIKTNEQFNQYSNIFFKRVSKNISINEL